MSVLSEQTEFNAVYLNIRSAHHSPTIGTEVHGVDDGIETGITDIITRTNKISFMRAPLQLLILRLFRLLHHQRRSRIKILSQ